MGRGRVAAAASRRGGTTRRRHRATDAGLGTVSRIEAEPELSGPTGQSVGYQNRIAVERRRFNESVQACNIRVQQFPAVIIANMAGFPPREFFEAATGAEEAPTVEF